MSFYHDVSLHILNPSVFIGNFEIREPVTSLTDFLTACVSGISFLLLFISKKTNRNKAYQFFQIYFLCYFLSMSSAAFLGHALQAYVPNEVKIIGWVFSTLGQLFLALGTLQVLKNLLSKMWLNTIHFILIFQCLIFIFLMLHPSYSNFKIAQLAATTVLIGIVLPLHIFNFFKTSSTGSRNIILTIIYAIIPAFIYNNQISISKWFNYHDISHVLMSIFMLMMYYSIKKLSYKD